MSLVKRGNIWYSYYRGADGKTHGKSLQTSDKIEAAALDEEIRLQNRKLARHRRARQLIEDMKAEIEGRVADPVAPVIEKKPERIRLSMIPRMIEQYRPMSSFAQRTWATFVRRSGFVYVDEITPQAAFAYLKKWYPGENGKSFNNAKGSLNRIFRTLEMDLGRPSPFEKIPARQVTPKHQRAFTEEECRRIMGAAREPFKSAFVIAYYTGLRLKDALNVRWADFDGDLLTVMPAKTSAFRRSVRLRVPAALLAYLDGLPRAGEKVLAAFPAYNPHSMKDTAYFSRLLDTLGITAGQQEIVNFNSARDTYVSRLAAAGVDLDLIGGAVGHTSEEQTRLYNTAAVTQEKINSIFPERPPNV